MSISQIFLSKYIFQIPQLLAKTLYRQTFHNERNILILLIK